MYCRKEGLVVGWVIACCLAGCVGGPSTLDALVEETTPADTKVLLIGIDGATFTVMKPLFAAGKLGQFKSLMDGGAHGTLTSVSPTWSAAIWTTIVTGRRREDHGITHFIRNRDASREDMELVTSNDRKTTALWNWVGAFGKSTGFQGWWASWPAEPVLDGWIISDRITRTRWAEYTKGDTREGITYPAELKAELVKFVVDPLDPPMDEIGALVEFTADELGEFHGASKPVMGHWLSVFKFAYCAQRSFERMALAMVAKGQPDLMGIFLVANDPISHTFWHFYEPDAFDDVDASAAARLGKLIPNFYEHNDAYLGELLAGVDEKTIVFVVSDHGFEASGIVPRRVSKDRFKELKQDAIKAETVNVGMSGMHHKDGIFIVYGGPIRKGVSVENASIYDVAPTILAAMGLPVPDDFEGRVLTEIFEPEFLEAHPVKRIRSYERYFERRFVDISLDDGDVETIESLRALGYIE